MDRRNFLKNSGTLLAGATLVPHTLSQASESRAANRSGRLVLPMNRNWRYSSSSGEEAHAKDFDDSGFERVAIPHANLRLPWHGFEEKAYEFISIYRRHFKLPEEARGKRVFVDFEAAMTASTVWINGTRIGEYRGGYTPFFFELTAHLDFDGENVLALELDSHERPDIPPFGDEIDYLTFGGIYREVFLRVVPASFIENVFVRVKNALGAHPSVEVDCFLQHLEPFGDALTLHSELLDGERSLARSSERIPPSQVSTEAVAHTVHLDHLNDIKLWNPEQPNLYSARVLLQQGTEVLDEDSCRFGFREAHFTDHGFELNGKVLKLRGLDRHQTFPFAGQAMPGRCQRRD